MKGERDYSSWIQAFIWRVPEDFTLRTEEGEDPKDVAPLKQFTGHSRY